MTRIIRSIAFEPEVLAALESERDGKQHHRSPFINDVLRREFNLPKKVKR